MFKVIKYTYGKPDEDGMFLLPNLVGKTIIGTGTKYKLGLSTKGALPREMLNIRYDKKNKRIWDDWFVAGRYRFYTVKGTSNKWGGTAVASGVFTTDNSTIGGGVSGHNGPLLWNRSRES